MRSFGLFATMLLCSATLCLGQAKVWIEPFKESNQAQQADWITRALQQSLADELSANGAQVVPGKAKPADARYVVTTTIQRVNAELRVSGQVIDVEGKTVGGFKATGTERDLFAIEDSVAQQVSQSMGLESKLAAATQPAGARARVEAPFAPIRFGYAGSDLEDAVKRNKPIEARPAVQYDTPVYPQQPVYQQPVNYGGGYYPPNYGYGYGYGGFGWGWPNYVIIGGGGSSVCPPTHGGGSICPPNSNGQAIRAASGFGGRTPPPGVVNTITNVQAPGVIHTMGGTPGVTAGVAGGGSRGGRGR